MYSYNSAGRVTMQDVRLSSTSGAPADLIATYTWDNMGRMTGLNYPLNGPEVAMSYDAMSRLIGETQTCQGANCQNPGTPEPLAAASYNFAGMMTSLQYEYCASCSNWVWTEARTYNSMLQLTQLVDSSPYYPARLNMTYNFSPTQNNGRIVSSADAVTGENVSYTYDSLNRLIAASTSGTTGVQWGNSYSYDGFGNLTGKTVTKGTAPTLSPLVDSNTNRVRLSGDLGYDANGNWRGAAGAPGPLEDGA